MVFVLIFASQQKWLKSFFIVKVYENDNVTMKNELLLFACRILKCADLVRSHHSQYQLWLLQQRAVFNVIPDLICLCWSYVLYLAKLLCIGLRVFVVGLVSDVCHARCNRILVFTSASFCFSGGNVPWFSITGRSVVMDSCPFSFDLHAYLWGLASF